MHDNEYERTLTLARYIMQMRPVFQVKALFSDETANYVEPMEPKPGETVTIRFRTAAKNVDEVYLISGPLREKLSFEKREGSFDYYTIRIEMKWELFRYYFEVRSGRAHCFYNKCGVTRDLSASNAFCIRPGFSTPDWAKGAGMYQILIDRLDGVPKEKRTARFVCVVAAAFPDGRVETRRGTIEGRIAYEPAGENGFGYDPIFYYPERGMTTAEISPEEKNRISHRGKALRQIREVL